MSQIYKLGTGGNNPFGPLKITSVVGSVTPIYTIQPTDEYIEVTTDAPVTILLPNTTVVGRLLVIKDRTGQAKTNPITVTTVGGAVLIDGNTSQIIDSNYGSMVLIFDAVAYQIW